MHMTSTWPAHRIPAALQRARLFLPNFTMDSLITMTDTCPAPPSALVDNMQGVGQVGGQLGEQGIRNHWLRIEEDVKIDPEKYRGIRGWYRLKREKSNVSSQDSFVLRMVSFNILAQSLLERYRYLYRRHNESALPWERRRQLILREIIDAQADIICLQEMQQDHLPHFIPTFSDLGYRYLYKKRTGDKDDGLLFLYRDSHFTLVDQSRIELRQSGIETLARDNVAIVVKLRVKSKPAIELVVATTHLLYNPKRNDVRLSQVQLILAEIERIAYIGEGATGPKYLPIILAGDFNLEPFTAVYEFLTQGTFVYQGKGRTLERFSHRGLSHMLVPPRLGVTDSCQHFNVLVKRLTGEGAGKIMLENSEELDPEATHASNSTHCNCALDVNGSRTQEVEIARGHRARFSTGVLSHPFRLRSVYEHADEATTHQGRWITVDFVFHTDDVVPVERYTLPTVQQCMQLDTIPNFAVGSDHLCLGATFEIRKPNL